MSAPHASSSTQKRLVPGAEEQLIEDLQWAGLQWDEGPGMTGSNVSYRQSERNHIYQQYVQELLASGAAYRCFCTSQSSGHGQAAYVTSGCYQNCSSLSSTVSREKAEDSTRAFTVRLRHLTEYKKPIYRDLVYSKIVPLKRTFTPVESDDGDTDLDAADTILIKSDGTPTYHFANVVDDHLMNITHVIRGVEWMASTPLHYDLYSAFGWQPPEFAHVGLLVDENKAKLSKRNSDLVLDVRSMREQSDILPESLVNFLALLGWSNPLRNDVYDLEGLADAFDLKFTKGNTMVKFEKLWFLQKQHVARRCEAARTSGETNGLAPMIDQITAAVKARWPDLVGSDRFKTDDDLSTFCLQLLLVDSKSYQNASQYVERNRYFFDLDDAEAPLPPTGPRSGDNDLKMVDVDSRLNVMKQLTLNIMDTDLDLPQKALRSSATEPPTTRLEAISDRLHTIIQREILRDVLAGMSIHLKNLIHSSDLPVLAHTMTEEQIVTVCKETLHVPVEDIHDMLQTVKARQGALMKYLRTRLSYGLPGPSVGIVMALLGYEECCRRLGVDLKAGKSWEGV
ncbi:hypothetical protein LTR62_007177 [Meristemomyces frigidus]|uniref:Glutamyl/glutaminyl-tRNA synthetase class Ib catalytic domain-containing protein n=1 Tax=Meristemomyces frigidus TaxID=1508187 RepID=A0AAN7TAZ6_9PEZI|nr:hypothetical protein LTR62_007177 [Meristemomyces frigidus]